MKLKESVTMNMKNLDLSNVKTKVKKQLLNGEGGEMK
jgi:hypothetical protein